MTPKKDKNEVEKLNDFNERKLNQKANLPGSYRHQFVIDGTKPETTLEDRLRHARAH